MKGKAGGIIQLLLSILVMFLFYKFYFKIFGVFGIKFSGTAYEIADFVRHILVAVIIFVIYYKNIKAGQNKFNKTFLNSLIYSVACFVFLIIITILVNKLVNYIGNPRGIVIGYNFTNYFDNHFNLKFALNFIEDAILIPFLLCILFPLGLSNIFKKEGTASIACGLIYGILYGVSLNTSFQMALFQSITPALIMVMLTYLYKTNHNIWSVVITYICYVLFGIFAINYI